MSLLREWARRAPLWTYFGVAFLFTWALLPWARTSIPVSLIALCGPAVAALLVAALAGRSEWQAIGARITQWRVFPRWFVFALVLPLPISAMASVLEYAWGARGTIQFQPVSALSAVVFVLVIGEEIGWRGFALPRLLARFGPWSASTILGTVWALWHLPLFYLAGMPQYRSPFVPFIGYTIGLSIILTFLAQRTAGSVIIATLFHGAVNTFLIVNTAAGPTSRGWGNAVSYGIVAVLIGVVAWKRRPRPNVESPRPQRDVA